MAAPATRPGVPRARIRLCRVSRRSPVNVDEGRGVRFIGLDVHRDFCEVAIAEGGQLRSAGRIATSVAALELFAQSLGKDDTVALEATSGAAKIARLIEPHVARVVVANTRRLAAISQAKAKTDRLDARTLARLLASGYLEQVWAPDEQARALRRLVGRRARLVRARTRAKNEVHGVLARNLCGRRRSCTSSARPGVAGSRNSSCPSTSS